jgi:UDP-glucose 4-epimerase
MIVVIGASSFIGTYLVDELISQGYEVFATGYRNSNNEYFSRKGIPYVQVNIARKEEFEQLPKENVDTLFLMSVVNPVRDDGFPPQRYFEVNTIGALNVLEYCRVNNVKKIIFGTSHSDVSGHWEDGRAITEEDETSINFKNDHAVFIISKIAALNLIERYRQTYGIDGITLRLPGVYGYGQKTEIYLNGKVKVPRFIVFIRNAIAGSPIEIWGDPKRGHDFVYVKDVVSAFISAMQIKSAHGLYNIASGVRTSIDDEVKGIIEVFSSPTHRSEINYRPDKPSIPNTYLYDISKAKRDLSYQVHYPFMKMLQDIKLEWERQRFPHLNIFWRTY